MLSRHRETPYSRQLPYYHLFSRDLIFAIIVCGEVIKIVASPQTIILLRCDRSPSERPLAAKENNSLRGGYDLKKYANSKSREKKVPRKIKDAKISDLYEILYSRFPSTTWSSYTSWRAQISVERCPISDHLTHLAELVPATLPRYYLTSSVEKRHIAKGWSKAGIAELVQGKTTLPSEDPFENIEAILL